MNDPHPAVYLNLHRLGHSVSVLLITILLVSQVMPSRAQTNDPLEGMTLAERVGQLFMVSAFGKGLPDSTISFLKEVMPGGVALFTYNGGTPEEVAATVNAWQGLSVEIGAKVPLLVAIDQEGGPVTRLTTGFSSLPAGWAIGAMPLADARLVGRIAGEELRAVGINMNLAPVTDVQTIESNPLMDRRTFGSDAARVGAAASAYSAGLADSGVVAVLKHFPGHGDAADSHALLPTVDYPLERVERIELESFRLAIKAGAQVVMVGHLVYPALDPTPDLPASLSPKIIRGVLRDELGFQGVAMSDAMDMGAIVDHYGPADAAVRAINAGIDLVATGPHMPIDSQRQMVRAVIEAVKSGVIPESRLNEAAGRVLALKRSMGALNWSPLDARAAGGHIKVADHTAQIAQIYERTVTVARNEGKLIPLSPGATRIALIYPGIYPATGRLCAAIDPRAKQLAYSQAPTDQEIAFAHSLAREVDTVVVFTYDAIYQPQQQALVKALPPEKTIVVAIQNPHDYDSFPAVAGYMASYMPVPAAFSAVCDVLYGARPAQGRLPISLTPQTKS